MERCELMALLFLHGMALAAWFVPMGSVLEGAGLRSLTPFAFAASAIAALMSPLFFGAMADRSVPPLRVLRWISFGTAILASIVALAIATGWNRWFSACLICTKSKSRANRLNGCFRARNSPATNSRHWGLSYHPCAKAKQLPWWNRAA
jgi:MFS family permease